MPFHPVIEVIILKLCMSNAGFSFSQFTARDYNLSLFAHYTIMVLASMNFIKLMHMMPLRVDVCDRME